MELEDLIDLTDNLSNASTILLEDLQDGDLEKFFDYPVVQVPDSSTNWMEDLALDLDKDFVSPWSQDDKSGINPVAAISLSNEINGVISDEKKDFEISCIESLSEQLERWHSGEKIGNENEESADVKTEESKGTSVSLPTAGSGCEEINHEGKENCKVPENCKSLENYQSDYPLLVPHHKIPVTDDRVFPNVSYDCKKCNKVFNSFDKRQNHKKYCLKGRRTFECNKCDYVTASSKTLKRHLGIHSLKKFYKCPKCIHITKRKYRLKDHIMRIHGTNRIHYECDCCKKQYLDKNKFREHIRRCVLINCESEKKVRNGKSTNLKPKKKSKKTSVSISTAGSVSKEINGDRGKENVSENCNSLENNQSDYPLLVPHYKIPVTDDRVFPNVSYDCKKCNKVFNSFDQYRNHESYCSKGKLLFGCDKCDYVTVNSKRLKKHLAVHSSKKFHKCPECTFITKFKCHMKDHVLRRHSIDRRNYECDICKKKYVDKKILIKHVSRCRGIKSKSKKKASNKKNTNLKEEKSKETSVSISTAGPVCKKINDDGKENVSENSKSLANNQSNDYPLFVPHHKIPVIEDKISPNVTYDCEKCKKCFNSLDKLQSHKVFCKSNLSGKLKNYLCPQCNFTIDRKSGLKNHIMRHHTTNRQNYNCDNCKKQYPSKKSLTKHVLLYDKIKHKCQHCEQSFCGKRALSTHAKTHKYTEGPTSYQCNICMFKSRWESSIANHSLVHKRTDLYICHECGRRFKRRASIKKHWHLRGHDHMTEKIQVFQCFMCPKFHRSIDDFIRHIVKVHGCEYLFPK